VYNIYIYIISKHNTWYHMHRTTVRIFTRRANTDGANNLSYVVIFREM